MISDLTQVDRRPTPRLARLGSTLARGCQAVVDARLAENVGQVADAVAFFGAAIEILDGGPDRLAPATLARFTRAAAQAGLVRLGEGNRTLLAMRTESCEWFEGVPTEQLDGADLGDYASVTGSSGPKRQELLERAARIGQPPVWVARQLINDADEVDLRLVLGVVRQAPLVAVHHEALAYLCCHTDVERSAALTVAAALSLDDGDWVAAVTTAETACALDQDNLTAALILADSLRLQNATAAAVEHLERVQLSVAAGSELAGLCSRARARAFEAVGQRRNALTVLTTVLDPSDDPDDWVLAGRLHSALGELDEARSALDRALALDPQDASVVYASVVDRLRRQQPDDAVGDLEAALERSPQTLFFHTLLADILARAGVVGAPDDQIARAVVLGARPADAWTQLAYVRNQLGDRRGTADALARGLEAGGRDDPEFLAFYGRILMDLAEPRLAVTVLSRAARLRPVAENQARLAEALLSAEKPLEAIKVLDRALRKDSGQPILLAWRGRSNRRAGDPASAERDLCQAIDRGANDVWVTSELFTLMCEQAGREQAIGWALDRLTTSQVADLAYELLMTDTTANVEAALKIADAALDRRNPDGSDLAWLLLVQGLGRLTFIEEGGDLSESDESLRRSADLLPQNAMIRVLLGYYFAASDRPDEAEKEIFAARALDPGSEDIAYQAVNALRSACGDVRALEELDKAIFHIGESLRLLASRADLLFSLTQDREAIEVIGKLRSMGSSDENLDRIEGLALVSITHYHDAIPLLQSVNQRDPDDKDVIANLASAMNAVGESNSALAVLRGIKPKEFDTQLLSVRGDVRWALRDRRCIEDFRSALNLDPGNVQVVLKLVDAAADLGQPELAKQYLDPLLEDPELADEAEVVRLLWVLNRPGEAIERADRSLANSPKSAPMLALKAGMLVEQEDLPNAIDAARRALEVDGTHVYGRYTLSLALERSGCLTEALVPLGDGDDALLRRQRVAVLLAMGKTDEAIGLVKDSLGEAGPPFDDGLWVGLGEALIAKNVLTPMATSLAVRLDRPPPRAILILMGKLLSAMGEFTRAAQMLELAGARESGADLDIQLAWAYSNVQPPRPEVVLRRANRALRGQPDNVDLLKNKADALLQMGRKASASRVYKTVLEKLLSSPSARGTNWLAGWCNYRLGNYDRALDHLLRSISMTTDREGWDRFDLGLVLLVSGRFSRARKEYDGALREVMALQDPLRRIGVLRVAMVDLDEASKLVLEGNGEGLAVAGELAVKLQAELSVLSTSAFVRVQHFMEKVDALASAELARRKTVARRAAKE